MEGLMSFDKFINEGFGNINPEVHKNAAGVAIIYDNKILLVHPANASWKKGTCGIPKGGVEKGEDFLEAALRELKEETGITLSASDIDPDPNVVTMYSRGGVPDRQLIYFVCKITSLDQIGLSDLKVPKSQLQAEEIDWAGFVSPEKAYPITSRSQMIILDRHLELSNK